MQGANEPSTGLDSLNYLDLTANVTLQNVSHIALCDSLRNLYLTNCNNMDNSEFAILEAIINRCNPNCTYPQDYGFLLSSSNSFDLSGTSITDSQLDKLSGKTNVKRLRLNGCTNLTNSKIESVLQTLTGLKYLSIINMPNATTINFARNLKIQELDLRGTNIVDLSSLNSNASSSLEALVLDNKNIPINNYQILLLNVCNNSATNCGGSESFIGTYGYSNRGLMLLCNFGYTINIPSDAKQFGIGNVAAVGVNTFDLSLCTNLKYAYIHAGTGSKFIMPSSLETIDNETWSDERYDLSRCKNLKFFTKRARMNNSSMEEILETLPEDNSLQNITLCRCSITDLTFLSRFNASKLTTLTISGWTPYESIVTSFTSTKGIDNATNLTTVKFNYTYLSDLTGMDNLKNLKNAYINYCKISDITKLSGCENLVQLELCNNTINDITPITALTNLSKVDLSYNKISQLKDLSKMTGLNSLNLGSNSVSDLSLLSKLIKYDGTTTIRTLILNLNPIEDVMVNGFSNIEQLRNLKNAGCTTINIEGTKLSSL